MYRILYHMDSDGHAAAAVVLWHLQSYRKIDPEGVKMHPINYGMPIPEEIDYEKDTVVMVDFSLQPAEEMAAFARKLGDRLIWIDHHETSVDMENECPELVKVPGERRVNFESGSHVGKPAAGCELAWKYFTPREPIPEILRLVGDWDTWRWKDLGEVLQGDVKALQSALRFYGSDPKYLKSRAFWLNALRQRGISNAEWRHRLGIGHTLNKYQQKEWKRLVGSRGFEADFQGLRAVMVNATGSSEMFNGFFDPEKHDVMVTYQELQGEYLTVSLYTPKTEELHLGRLAKKLGDAGDRPSGGGHAGAAGFQCGWEYFKSLYTVTGNFRKK